MIGLNTRGVLISGSCTLVTVAMLYLYSIAQVIMYCSLSLSLSLVDGNLWMWGWGARGQLGQGDVKNLNTPTLVEGFK